MTGVWLALLALLLAGPVPDALGRAAWTARAPRAAIVLWQAVALAAVLAAVGSALAGPEEFLRLREAQRDGLTFGADLVVAASVAAMLAGVITVRLLVSLGRLAVSTRRRRARHRTLVDLIGSESAADRQVRILDGDHPVAYCVPGRRARVVISRGTTQRLSPAEVDAVVAHERAHLRSRHDLVIEAFTALHDAFPRWVRSRVALESVGELLEMLADDHAARAHGRAAVSGALAAMSEPGDGQVARRIRRLRSTPAAGPRLAGMVYAGAGAVLLVPTVTLAMPWLAAAYAALPALPL